jgi:predicted  nucleic acid-binding Zn-ribbon protein
MGVRLSNPLADQVAELEEDYAKLINENESALKHLATVIDEYQDLQTHIKDLEEELEWYRSTFPEGSDAYACMRRME